MFIKVGAKTGKEDPARRRRLCFALLSYRTFGILCLLPLIVIILRIKVWAVPRYLTNLMALDMLVMLFFFTGRIGLSLYEWRTGILNRPVPQSLLKRDSLYEQPHTIKDAVSKLGYRYDESSAQGVNRPLGNIFALLSCLCGLWLLVPTGLYDYLYQFSGIVYLGTGEPLSLNVPDNYGAYSRGTLTSYSDIGMKLRGYDIIPPSAEYPQGAKDIAVLDPGGKELWRGLLTPGSRHRQGGYDLYLENFVYDIFIGAGTVKGHGFFNDRIRVYPLKQPSGDYTHYGSFEYPLDKIKGEISFDMKTDRMTVRMTHDGEKVEGHVGMAPESHAEVGGYTFTLSGIGKWTHINVMRVRHINYMKTGGILLLAALVFGILYPARKVWLLPGNDGKMRVCTNDRQLLRLVGGQG